MKLVYKSAIFCFFAVFALVARSEKESNFAETDASSTVQQTAFVDLFDGKTLNGWHKIGGEATFVVDNGEILGEYGPGKNTFLRTDSVYADFVLTLEAKWEVLSNSGIMFRAQQRADTGRAFGLQYELDPKERAWSAGIYDEHRRKWLVPLPAGSDARAAIKLDDWNAIKIKAVGGRVQTWLNGVAVADFADSYDLEGFIGLQVHSGKKGRIRFRSIKLKDLGRHAWSSDYIADATNWVVPDGGEVSDTEQGNLVVSNESFSSVLVRTQAALGDFALRFELEVCDQASLISLREWRNDGGPGLVQISLTATGARLHLGDHKSNSLSEIKFRAPAGKRLFTITAVGDDISIAIDETQLGRVHNQNLPPRGIFSVQFGCKSKSIGNLRWVDLEDGSRNEPLYRSLDIPSAPVLSAEEAKQAFRIAPGYRIELVVAEPFVEDPVATAWDENGRLYVVEMRGFMPDSFGIGQHEPVGRVVLLEDSNEDGQMDKRTVFLDKLILPRAIAVVDGGVLIGVPPNLWLCTDTSGDGVCDQKKLVGKYAAHKGGSVEHRENGLFPALDNWMYNVKSDRRLLWRNGELKVETTLFRGQWGMTQDNEGRLIYNNNSNYAFADFYPSESVLNPAATDSPAGLYENLMPDAEVFSIRVNPGVNRSYIEGRLRDDGRLKQPTAASGMAVYRGNQFGAGESNDLFVTEPGANVVTRIHLSGQGIKINADHVTYTDPDWGTREFLASTDERFRPVDAKVGPDGALYITDMYRGIIQDVVFLTEELREQIYARGLDTRIGRGRIWRVVKKDQPIDYSAPKIGKMTSAELIDTLGHANGWHRDTAQRLLVDGRLLSDEDLARLKQLVSNQNLHAAVHALWVLEGRNAIDRDTVLTTIELKNDQLILQALRVGGAQLSQSDLLTIAASYSYAVSGTSAEKVLQQLVVQLAAYNDNNEVLNYLASVAQKQADNIYLRVSVMAALRGQELRFYEVFSSQDWLQLESDSSSDMLKDLAANAYRSAGNNTESHQQLLNIINAFVKASDWRAAAMLTGLREVLRDKEFKPADLGKAHPLFSAVSDSSDLNWAYIASARLAYTWPGDTMHDVQPLSAVQAKQRKLGKSFYLRTCAGCHHSKGLGMTGLAPALAFSPWVTGPPEILARIVLQGLQGPVVVDGKVWNGIMPGHADIPEFNDGVAAGTLTFIRTAFGNKRGAVSEAFIQQIRIDTADHSGLWTIEELQALLTKPSAIGESGQ